MGHQCKLVIYVFQLLCVESVNISRCLKETIIVMYLGLALSVRTLGASANVRFSKLTVCRTLPDAPSIQALSVLFLAYKFKILSPG